MTDIFLYSAFLCIALLLLLVLYSLILLVKNNVTAHNRKIILKAIFEYHIDCISHHRYSEIMVDYFDLEPYEKTLYRLWDWGYKRILPPDKFEVIKPYL